MSGMRCYTREKGEGKRESTKDAGLLICMSGGYGMVKPRMLSLELRRGMVLLREGVRLVISH